MMRSDARTADTETEAARRAREAVEPPAEVASLVTIMERWLDTAARRLAEPTVALVRMANLARISAANDPPIVAMQKIKATAAHFREVATALGRPT